jgi:hypothetical protein
MTSENKVPRPRAIQPCLDIGTSLLEVHTVVAQTTVTISIATSTASKTNWPPLGPCFGGGEFKIASFSVTRTRKITGPASD